MNIIKVPLSKVKVWELNPRNIKTKDFNRLKEQIRRLGVYKPLICYKENGLFITLGGNMRLRALKDLATELKIENVDISIVDPKTEAEKVEFNLSDNDRAGEYDDQALAEMVYNVKDKLNAELFRFDLGNTVSTELLLTQFGPKIEAGNEDDVVEPEVEPIAEMGDLYELGSHRLICGDSTKKWTYDALLEGKQAHIIFTDPPYNVAYQGTKFGPIMSDNMSEDQFIEFTLSFMARMKENTRKGGIFYICSGYSSYPIFVYAIRKLGMVFAGPIVWVKNNTSLGWNDYRHKHEMILKASNEGRKKAQPILYGWNGGRHYFLDSRFEADVWEMARRASQTMLHPTQRPLGLIQRALRNSSKANEILLDPFAGSGSTVIACEREGRIAYAIDMDPIYVDVIIRRFAAQGGPTEKEIRATKKKIKIPAVQESTKNE